jgi:hypothetical protein
MYEVHGLRKAGDACRLVKDAGMMLVGENTRPRQNQKLNTIGI